MGKLPIGLRNNNPGNIRVSESKFKGELPSDNAFKKFDTIVNGYRAMFVLLRNYNRLYGINTIRGIVSRYAPPTENNTSSYIEYVCMVCNYPPDKEIDFKRKKLFVLIVYAMAYIETGYKPDIHVVEEGFNASL